MTIDHYVRTAGDARVRSATVAAYAVAGVFHVVTAGLFAAGLSLTVLGFSTVVQPMIGLLLLALTLTLRPRPQRLDTDLPTLREADAPALFALLHRVADSTGVRRVEAVQLTAGFSARVVHHGFRRRRCLALGLPLWVGCPPQQRIAAVAQALVESGPRNVRRGVFVGSALGALRGGVRAMGAGGSQASARIDVHAYRADEMAAGVAVVQARSRATERVLWLPRIAAAACARLLLRLTRPSVRQARLASDEAAARTASTRATLAALRDRQLARAIDVEMHRLTVERKSYAKTRGAASGRDEFWDGVARHAERLRERPDAAEAGPPSEAESGRRRFRPAVEDTDAWRRARLVLGPQHPATITLDEADRVRIEDELRPSARVVERLVLRDGVTRTA
ncbi:M48 family metallopeptidase [Streptomyces fragilis]|uniref:M48 family metallopeptidase n=1 Tax=Streptomyces fragilis TaxID=67301 RepID=UPI0024DE0A73|nr:M48 family metallopeptidase [Streptomyces fragilis]